MDTTEIDAEHGGIVRQGSRGEVTVKVYADGYVCVVTRYGCSVSLMANSVPNIDGECNARAYTEADKTALRALLR